MPRTTASAPPKVAIQPLLGHPPVQVPLLAGISGRMRVDVRGQPLAAIDVQNGQVSISDQQGEPTVIANVEDVSDLERMARGELNPVVAGIQGRLVLQGDAEFGIELILALNATHPFAWAVQQKEGKA